MSQTLLFVTGALVMVLGAYLTFRVVVRRAYLTRGRTTAVPLILEILICAAYANFPYLYLPYQWPELPIIPSDPLIRIPGVTLVVIGVVIIVVGMASLGFRRLFELASPAIYDRGLYGLSRNPQLIGFFIYALGFALLWPSWYSAGWVLLYVPVFHMMVITEEEYLLEVHGGRFRDYCRRVPRYLHSRIGPFGATSDHPTRA